MEPNDWIWAGGWRRKFFEIAQEWLSEETRGGATTAEKTFESTGISMQEDKIISRVVVPESWERFAKKDHEESASTRRNYLINGRNVK